MIGKWLAININDGSYVRADVQMTLKKFLIESGLTNELVKNYKLLSI